MRILTHSTTNEDFDIQVAENAQNLLELFVGWAERTSTNVRQMSDRSLFHQLFALAKGDDPYLPVLKRLVVEEAYQIILNNPLNFKAMTNNEEILMPNLPHGPRSNEPAKKQTPPAFPDAEPPLIPNLLTQPKKANNGK